MEWLKTTFERPEYLWFLLVLIPMIAWYIWKGKDQKAKLKVSTIQAVKPLGTTFWYKIRLILPILRMLAVSLLIIAIARPYKLSRKTTKVKGIDIVMAMDISTSMLANDFHPNRLSVAKRLATNFIKNRPDDRIGIVAFARESFTVCPLTTDHTTAINLLNKLQAGMVEDGTAIGLGLANAVVRLKESTAKSKVIILLTDGVNNSGEVSPLDAAQIAAQNHIRVYTIGIGSRGRATITYQGNTQVTDVEIDEKVLTKIANMTGGRYFRAKKEKKLAEIYDEIDKMEKTIIEKNENYNLIVYAEPFLLAALLLLLLEIILRLTIYRTIP